MRRAASALMTLVLASPPPSASAPQGDRRQPPVFSSEVSLVLLPVFVVDRKGQAVRGLQPEDFEVYEDGKRAETVSFRYVDTTSEEDQEALRQATAARRRFLLLFDKSFTDPAGLNRAQRAASQFVRQRLAESDLAAVATFDIRNGIRLVANFTDDRALLVHAVETLGVPSLARISDPLALAADLGAPATDLSGRGGQEVPQALLESVLAVLARQMRAAEVEAYRGHIMTLISSLQGLATALRHVEGRKQILYFSAGFDSRLLIGQQGSEQKTAADAVIEGRLWEVDGATRYGDSRLVDLLADTTKSLARADAVVHSVDVTGLVTDGSLTRTYLSEDAARENSGREALHFLSAETGGRFFKDANNLEPALGEMLEMTSRYYVLGVQPLRPKGPGAFHKIRVKVARKNVTLSHRAGYYDRVPAALQTALQRQFEAAQLVLSGVGRNDLEFSSLCLPFPDPGERQALGLVVQVPRESLTWQPDRPTTVEIYGYAVGEDGTVLDHLAQLARVDPARADPRGSMRGLSFFGTLGVPPGRYTVRLLVQERESGASGVQFLEVRVPPYDPRRGFLLPPLLMDDADRWISLEMGRGKAAHGLGHPLQVAGESFVPRASSEMRTGASQKMVLIAYEAALPGDPATDVLIRSSLLDHAGRAAPAGRLKIDAVHREPGGRRTYVLGFTPDAIDPGDYTLRIGLGEGGSHLESYARIHLRPGS